MIPTGLIQDLNLGLKHVGSVVETRGVKDYLEAFYFGELLQNNVITGFPSRR